MNMTMNETMNMTGRRLLGVDDHLLLVEAFDNTTMNETNATYGRKLQQFGLFSEFWAPAAEAIMDFWTPFSLPYMGGDEGNVTYDNYTSSGRKLLGTDDLLLMVEAFDNATMNETNVTYGRKLLGIDDLPLLVEAFDNMTNMTNATYGRRLQQFEMLNELFSAIPPEISGYLAPALDALQEYIEPFTGELPFFDAFDAPNVTNATGRKLLGADDLQADFEGADHRATLQLAERISDAVTGAVETVVGGVQNAVGAVVDFGQNIVGRTEDFIEGVVNSTMNETSMNYTGRRLLAEEEAAWLESLDVGRKRKLLH